MIVILFETADFERFEKLVVIFLTLNRPKNSVVILLTLNELGKAAS